MLFVVVLTICLVAPQVLGQSSVTVASFGKTMALQTEKNLTQRGLTVLHPLPLLSLTSESPIPTPGVRPGGNLICYSCKLDFRKQQYQWNHPCLGRHNHSKVSDDFLVNCGPTDTLCRVERTEVNGVLIMLRRECSNSCYNNCRPKGFGINYEVCERCCKTDACNHIYPASSGLLLLPSFSVVLTLGWWVVAVTLLP
ncbi:hypothetical protein Hamer_G015239 [Homarus americanus]|uniref:Snake toxin/toxin-like domain-containing protein n=1 Tax=Homarus americanus TaxID=6706 RepID=A0A8J5N907_HOMAM|nr:hypothetical protein Hamer_G015239 [Homarus americanus]